MRMRLTYPCLLTLLTANAVVARSQSGTTPLHHRNRYTVTGTMQGDAMDPWTSMLAVSDSSVNTRPAVSVRYDSRESPAGFLYRFSALLELSGTRGRVEWISNGRSHSTCTIEFESGTLAGRVDSSVTPRAVRVDGYAIPDFAIGAFFSTQKLAAGDAVRFTMFRCLAHRGESAIDAFVVTGTVTEASDVRGGQLEPVWRITGSASYPFFVSIAKSDRAVLRMVTPQGSVGSSMDAIAGLTGKGP